MKIVIDIPENVYEYCKRFNALSYFGQIDVTNAIANGTPFNSVLADIKTEIQDIYVGYRHGYEIMADVLAIFDKYIGKE